MFKNKKFVSNDSIYLLILSINFSSRKDELILNILNITSTSFSCRIYLSVCIYFIIKKIVAEFRKK